MSEVRSRSEQRETEAQAERIWRAIEDPATQREILNPFDGCPWDVYFNRLTEGYMAAERDPHVPIGDVHVHWAEQFSSDQNIGMLAHRDALKTTFTLGYLIACLEYIDGFRAHWITNTQGQAHKKADTELWKMVDRNPWLTKLNADPIQDTKEAKEWPHGSMLYAGWLFGAIEGDRSHLLVLDDVIKEHGDGDTQTVLQWIEGVTVPMVKDSGKTAVVGTRKRPDDIYSHLIDREAYNFTEYPAILEAWDTEFGDDGNWLDRRPPEALYTKVDDPWNEGETIHVLWPEARGPEYLAKKRRQMSSHLFWREYCMVIRGASGDLVKESDINRLVDDGGCSIRGRSPPRTYQAGSGEATIVSLDPAQSPSGDNIAFYVTRVGRDGRRTVLDAIADKGMPPSQVKATLLDLDERYDPAVIAIESNGIQQYIANDAIEFSPSLMSKVVKIPTTGQKHSWENGIPRLRTLVENGGIHFYRGHGGTESFIEAAMSLELSNGKLKGHTPDLIAAWYMAEEAIRRLERSGAFDEQPASDPEDSGVSSI